MLMYETCKDNKRKEDVNANRTSKDGVETVTRW